MQPYLISKVQYDYNTSLNVGCDYATITPPIHIQELHDKIRKHSMTKLQVTATGTNPSLQDKLLTLSEDYDATFDNNVSLLMGYVHIRRRDTNVIQV